MQSLKKERLSVMVTDAIHEIIRTEKLKPGDKLYSEKELSSKLEVSRSSIREALRMLEVSGVVKVYQGKGVFISDQSSTSHPVKEWVVENADALREHFEVRLLIEPHAAYVACQRAEAKDLEVLESLYKAFVSHVGTGDVSQAIASDSAFHLAIAKATKNRTLSVLMRTMDQTLNEGWYASLHAPGRLQSSISEHGRLLQAIKDHNPEEACQAMETHLRNALSDIQLHFGTL
ncbi:HTH-type transcriptional regulator LutR [bioreactor metagenome]|jgi:GntR family transcriptional repressor for pyruvate dehydrogenase complex|uniref:HTH-type transcriptional regulator LutR n=1 Tax=bioreactor metagenome TaxID=1076179 RepID=A0A644YCC1_9ZZZZ|nr:FadR/GntR family transcriptional regulator [Sphaerochaeta sp.]